MSYRGRLLICLAMLLAACGDTESFPRTQSISTARGEFSFKLREEDPETFFLEGTDEDGKAIRSMKLPYPLYQFQAGDLNDNGDPDCLLGVIKPTPYDSMLRKRIFIYELQGSRFVPLWEGSRMPHPVEDFRLKGRQIRTQEYEQNGLYLVATYRLGAFGPDFIEYLARNVDREKAQSLLDQ